MFTNDTEVRNILRFYYLLQKLKKNPNVESITKTEMQLICANPKGINLQIVKYQMFRTIHINAFSSPTQNLNLELHTFEILMRLQMVKMSGF